MLKPGQMDKWKGVALIPDNKPDSDWVQVDLGEIRKNRKHCLFDMITLVSEKAQCNL